MGWFIYGLVLPPPDLSKNRGVGAIPAGWQGHGFERQAHPSEG